MVKKKGQNSFLKIKIVLLNFISLELKKRVFCCLNMYYDLGTQCVKQNH